ncbi:MAG: hypothetical protein H6563_01090 [Lewinellaceae bacterium]|nr:hypothetical protein [Lewinellaceae bacterium]
MGQDLGTIMIGRIQGGGDKDVSHVLSRLQESFDKDKEGLTYNEFLDEKWDRRSEGLIGFFFNERIIIIEDEYDLVENSILEELSGALETEIVRVVNSDTAGISVIRVYFKGELARMKSFGFENDIDHLSDDELKSVKGLGNPTVYEKNGSEALNVFYSFIDGKVSVENMNPISIFKVK